MVGGGACNTVMQFNNYISDVLENERRMGVNIIRLGTHTHENNNGDDYYG